MRKLERGVYDTVRYFALLKMPVTKVQVWKNLVIDKTGAGRGGRELLKFRLEDVNEALWHLVNDKKLVQQWGYFMLDSELNDRMSAEQYVRSRLWRHALAQEKWKIARQVVRKMRLVPFVRVVVGSGSLAMFNTGPRSDIDLLVVVRTGRIWTARLLLLLMTGVARKRRKHWDEVAPDKICLNHYVTDHSLKMAREIRNMYTAQLYSQAWILLGLREGREWREANVSWMRRLVKQVELLDLPSRLMIKQNRVMDLMKQWLEAALLELPGDGLEKLAERLQRTVIERHSSSGRKGRVVVSDRELAFHPGNKANLIVAEFLRDEGQGKLL